jgi:long-chain acyl-CoA synthetase
MSKHSVMDGSGASTVGPDWPVMSLKEIEAELCTHGSLFEMETVVVNGIRYPCWKNQHRNLADLARAAHANYRDREFLIYEGERVTYDGWFKAVAQLSEHMVAQGIEKGDRVALAMRNLPEWPVAFFAIVSTGAIVVPLNAWWSGAELQHGLEQSGSRMLICDEERWHRVQPQLSCLPQLEQTYVSRRSSSELDGAARLEEIIGSAPNYGDLPERDLPGIAIEPDDDATILYTSGTTGVPKGALATHRSNLGYILGAAYAAARAARRRGEILQAASSRVLLSPVPFFHVSGLNACLLPLIDAGGTYVMMRKWDAGRALELVEGEKVTSIGGVPTVAWALLEHPDRSRRDLSSLQTISYGGASAAPELAQRIWAELRVSPHHGWGMTETCAVGTRHGDEDYLHRAESCGPPSPGTELRIVEADNGRALPTGAVGELWVKGAHVIKGYWNNAEASAVTIQDGWLRTGDLARLDEEGFCYIVGRAKEVIIRGGENVYPIEIENVLFRHPAVVDAAVVGIAHKTLGEEPAAAVHLATDASTTEGELRAWVATHLAAFKAPVKIAFFGSMLPRNASGKILKRELRTMFEGIEHL